MKRIRKMKNPSLTKGDVYKRQPLDWSNDPVAEIFGGYEAMNNYLY